MPTDARSAIKSHTSLYPLPPDGRVVTTYRGLLTAREREILRGEADVSRNYLYQIRSRVRDKIEELATDVELLRTHQPDLFDELRETVVL